MSSSSLVEAIDYVQGCLTIARTEFSRENPDAAVVELKKAATRLSEAVENEREAA